MSEPHFTQKHYEFLMTKLHELGTESLAERGATRDEMDAVVHVLCKVFAADNPKFKAGLFRATALGINSDQQKETTS